MAPSGGPLTYAKHLGKAAVLETLRRLLETHGERYRAAGWLETGL